MVVGTSYYNNLILERMKEILGVDSLVIRDENYHHKPDRITTYSSTYGGVLGTFVKPLKRTKEWRNPIVEWIINGKVFCGSVPLVLEEERKTVGDIIFSEDIVQHIMNDRATMQNLKTMVNESKHIDSSQFKTDSQGRKYFDSSLVDPR